MLIEIKDEKLLVKIQSFISHDVEACRFLQAYASYCHKIDDFIDNGCREYEIFLAILSDACLLFSSNFYSRYSRELYPIVVNITSDYADSLQWEKNPIEWKAAISDSLRMAGSNMLRTVVGLVAGYNALREISNDLRSYHYSIHHDKDGRPI